MTAPVPDHAALPVEQLRALLAIPPEWPAHLECDHCGDVAIYADADGLFADGAGEKCLSCGFPGHVDADGDGYEWSYANWVLEGEDDPAISCDRPSCTDDMCRANRLPPPGGNRSTEGATT